MAGRRPPEAGQNGTSGGRANRSPRRIVGGMEILEVALTFAGLAMAAAIPLVALLHSAEARAARRAHRDRPG
ncbi:hypothetical protein GTS_27720 [Gandjariella thermophila]|uniref:Uncharacterized protein n=1 Tax=Gandjariella thermophila TaxID=1931992 RepID=A0A4D4J9Q2_9PSEU|nr:hypothetical protein GTS_27720 [Gandjariella thermophila]